MASLQVRGPEFSVTKQKALEDAKKMQKSIVESCTKAGKEIPKYQLSELIGKGSFGRVYKATSLTNNQLVAVKIIDIDGSDTQAPKLADTYSDLLKEINALKLLGDSGAKNINHVIDALPVGHSMWMITEYCAGGSVSTLMRPTAPGGLQEKWIIPILRETAEALHWVHAQGIIHRDVKCGNVLVTETGAVQLCDFGVAGVIENKFDKRSTVIGTPHWMAPELFDATTSYGTEIDIWAFGSMVHEIASGMPPNGAAGMGFSRLGSHLKHHTPRLEGDRYSAGLKDLVSFCLQHDPRKRPTIEKIQGHGYICRTEDAYPASSLSHLVRGFKLWEAQGGDRKSLFSIGGAQGPTEMSAATLTNDEWNFSTTAAFDQQVFHNGDAQDVFDVYGSQVDMDQALLDDVARAQQQKPKSRRRPPPQLPSVKAPLEKLFDPNTISNYEDNSRSYYGRPFPMPVSDLPLRDDSMPSADVRESLIDLDASLHGSDLSSFVDMETLRAGDSRISNDYDFADVQYANAPLSDPADHKDNRRTQDWKFPTMPPPASANPEMSRFPLGDEGQTPSNTRPPLLHHPTEPMPPSAAINDLAVPQPSAANNRASAGSLIDLDMSLPDSSTDYTRPSTSHSDVGSVSGSEVGGVNPFELEKHASLYAMPSTIREPSIYVSDDFDYTIGRDDDSAQEDFMEERGPKPVPAYSARQGSLSGFTDAEPEYTPQRGFEMPYLLKAYRDPHPSTGRPGLPSPEPIPALPPLPVAPSPQVLEGMASREMVKEELRRLAVSLGEHLNYANACLNGLPVQRSNRKNPEDIGDAS